MTPLYDPSAAELRRLRDDVNALRQEVARGGGARLAQWGRTAPDDRLGNLAHYLALRSQDLSELQLRLSAYGLSSLGRSEADVLISLDSLLATLRRLCGENAPYPSADERRAGEEALNHACAEVFGHTDAPHCTRIMATLPSEAAEDRRLVENLLQAGMDCARINCAHDDKSSWARMIENVRGASQSLTRPCRILMDIAGPKLRITEVRAPEKYRLHPGERLRLVRRIEGDNGPVSFSINVPEIIPQLRRGAKIAFDDGKATGQVIALEGANAAELEIVAARSKGLRLKRDKGVNFPSTDLNLAPLTAKDLIDLDFIADQADLVGFSFVQRVEDVKLLQAELAARRRNERPQILVLKIETPLSVRNLPQLIAQAAARHPTAVMIARGDLAVEVGFARLSELQEEILWLCQAAHAPVIWATEVLDRLVHEGVASRPETTDAAMSQQADCVMLNKGEYLTEGVRFLRGVLDRMERHHAKKFPRLARLRAWS